jgi:rod shape-determining protein MreC
LKIFNNNRIAFAICMIISVLILVTYTRSNTVYAYMEGKILDSVAPIMQSINVNVSFISKLTNNINKLSSTFEENKKLKERNDFLEYYFYVYKQIEGENKLLKDSLNFNKDIPYEYQTAQVIGRSNTAFNQQLIINAGSNQGIEKEQIVLLKNQLLGRVIRANQNTAKILLITDPNSHIPVISTNSRTKFMASGKVTDYLDCKYLNEQPNLEDEDLVITNGDNQAIKAGIIVGSIFKEGDTFYVKPNIDFDKIEFVQIIKTYKNE